MIRRLTALSLLVLATAAPAQQASPAERQRLAALGNALARCHGGIVRRDAPGRFTPAQIADRALAGCARQEASIRAELLPHLGPQRTAQTMQAQRAHWRQAIAQMVAQARGRH